MKRFFITLSLILCLVFPVGCSGIAQLPATGGNQGGISSDSSDSAVSVPLDVKEEGEMFSDRDGKTDYDGAACVTVTFDGTGLSGGGEGVEISGTVVTLTKEGTYRFTGNCQEGQIGVDAPEDAKVHLILENLSLTSSSSAALSVTGADKVFVTLVGGNLLANGGSFSTDGTKVDGAIFSKSDLTVNGSGSLTVTSPAGHGLVCKDDLVLTGGNLTVTAASHGLQAKDSIRIKGATLTLNTGKDGLHAEHTEDAAKGFIYIASGSVTGKSEGDGISASGDVQIEDGTFDFLTGGGYENGDKASSDGYGGMPGFPGGGDHGGGPGGGRPGGRSLSTDGENSTQTDQGSTSMKGFKGGNILISGGIFTVDSADDAFHSNGSLTVTGGKFTVASGDDAFHGEENLTVTGGEMEISTCYEGVEAQHIVISGGNLKLKATDDGLNAAGGTDQSGTGGRDEMFGGFGGGPGGPMMGSGNGSILISGGTLYIQSSGDGIDANGTLEITGGHTTVVGPTQGDTATLDYDKTAVISGGTFLGTGASGMAQSFSDSSQGVLGVQVGTQGAGTQITVTDKEGKVLLSYAPELSYQVFIFSSPDLVSGQSYTLNVGTQSAEITAN